MKKIYSLLVFCLIKFAQSQNFEKLILTQNFELIRANTFFIEKTDDDKLNIQKIINDALFDYNFSVESDKMKANYIVTFSYKYRLNNGCEGRDLDLRELLDSTDFGIEVTIKIMGDREGFVRAGLKNLTLTYSGFDKNMDSLFSELKVLIEGSEFSPIYMKQKNFVIADGNSYLLEKFSYGQFKATANTYWLRDTTNVIKKFHLLVPPGILPDLEKARKVEDVLFPVFK